PWAARARNHRPFHDLRRHRITSDGEGGGGGIRRPARDRRTDDYDASLRPCQQASVVRDRGGSISSGPASGYPDKRLGSFEFQSSTTLFAFAWNLTACRGFFARGM